VIKKKDIPLHNAQTFPFAVIFVPLFIWCAIDSVPDFLFSIRPRQPRV